MLKIALVAPLAGVLSQPYSSSGVGPMTTTQPAASSLYNRAACIIASNTPIAERACACHYLSCTPTGDCSCGWDEQAQTCRPGIPTTCTACPIMRRCGTDQPLLIGPDGFPLPQDVGWGRGPFLQGDEGRTVMVKAQELPKAPPPPNVPAVPVIPVQPFPKDSPLYVHTPTQQASTMPTTQVFGSTSAYPSVSSSYPSMSTSYPSMSTSYPTMSTSYPTMSTSYPSMSTSYPSTAFPAMSSGYPTLPSSTGMVSWSAPMSSGIASWQVPASMSPAAPMTTPAPWQTPSSWPAPVASAPSSTFLYNNRAPTIVGGQVQCVVGADVPLAQRACACHYLFCNVNRDCACGWDDQSQTCRPGISTSCTACPSMHRCGDIVL